MTVNVNLHPYASISKATAKWRATVEAEQAAATNGAGKRAEALREEKRQEEHVKTPGKPQTQGKK